VGWLELITAWVDHVSEVDGDRYANIMFGGGDRLKTLAYQKILNEVGAVAKVELTLFHGHLIVHTEGVRSVQTAYPQAAVSGAIS